MKKKYVSDYYQGESGREYSDSFQTDPNMQGYAINFQYFKPYLAKQDIVLDFGCGDGGMLRLIANHVRKADGLEVNQYARNRALESGLSVYTGLSELPNEPIYDVILSNHVLEHIPDVASTLIRLKECLKINGRLLLKLPMDDWRASEQRIWSSDDRNHHLYTWTPLTIGNLITDVGFEVKMVTVLTSAWHPKFFPFLKFGIGPSLFWLLAVLKKRRQLFVVGIKPQVEYG